VVALAGALVAHMEGRGHACLPIDGRLLPFEDDGLLGWPAAALAEFRTLLSGLPAKPADWLGELRGSAVVFTEGNGRDDAHQPLVLDGDRLYLRRHWRCERRIAGHVLDRVARGVAVDEPVVRAWLDRLFGAASPGAAPIDWQKLACGIALRSRLSFITGGPGTGKTYTAARLLALLYATDPAPQALRVSLAAPTGKAAARLKQAIDGALDDLQQRLGEALPLKALAGHIGPARTLHSLLGARPDTRRFRHDAAHPLEADVLIVDEASMIHLEMMASLLEAVRPEARIVFLGDKDQLASVEAGAVLGDLCRHAQAGRYDRATRAYALAVTGEAIPAAFAADDGPPLAQQTVMLRESRRFHGPIGQLALAVNRGDADTAAALLREAPAGALHWLEEPALSVDAVVRLAVRGREGAPGGYGDYVDALRRRPPPGGEAAAHQAWVHAVLSAFERFRLLCAVREGAWGVAGMNLAVERALAAEGGLARRGGGEWYEGRPVMVTRNDPAAGVFNGDIGIALAPQAPGAPLRVHFLEGPQVRSVAVSRLADVETAFAMTVHKSQGSEFDHTVLVLQQDTSSSMLTRELLYTGITRARGALTLAVGSRQVFADALARSTRRASGLPQALGDG
jgi:exodeoxyribonuclease V alpha subunit